MFVFLQNYLALLAAPKKGQNTVYALSYFSVLVIFKGPCYRFHLTELRRIWILLDIYLMPPMITIFNNTYYHASTSTQLLYWSSIFPH